MHCLSDSAHFSATMPVQSKLAEFDMAWFDAPVPEDIMDLWLRRLQTDADMSVLHRVDMSVLLECWRFLHLKVVTEDYWAKELSPPGLIDLAWHALILQTEDYDKVLHLIHNHLKKPFKFVHHDADASYDSEEAKAVRRNVARRCYMARYEVPPPKVWSEEPPQRGLTDAQIKRICGYFKDGTVDEVSPMINNTMAKINAEPYSTKLNSQLPKDEKGDPWMDFEKTKSFKALDNFYPHIARWLYDTVLQAAPANKKAEERLGLEQIKCICGFFKDGSVDELWPMIKTTTEKIRAAGRASKELREELNSQLPKDDDGDLYFDFEKSEFFDALNRVYPDIARSLYDTVAAFRAPQAANKRPSPESPDDEPANKKSKKEQIHIKTLHPYGDGTTLSLDDFNEQDTVRCVKERIRDALGIARRRTSAGPDPIRLAFAGRILVDDQTLAEQSIKKDSTLQIKGGFSG